MMLRCRRCRKGLINSSSLLAVEDEDESPATVCSIWHVNVDALPEWILTSLQQAQWTVGKLNCQNCSARLGGFNFIHHFECPCGRDATIHLNKSRVDPEHQQCVFTAQLRMRKPRTELESQTESHHNETRLQNLPITDVAATSRSSPAVSGENSRAFSFSPLDCIRKQRQHSTGEVATVRSSCFHSAGPADASVWLLSTDAEQPARASRPLLRQHEAASEASVRGCSLISARRLSPPHQQLQQHLGEASAVPEQVPDRLLPHRARPDSDIPPEGEEQVTTEATLDPLASNQLSKREKNRLKGLRRKQRKKERWLHSQLEKAEDLLQDSEEEREGRDGLTCAVCLDIYVCPYVCRPCGHSFCEPCLRTIANNRPMNTPCPLCRTLISHTDFNKELNQSAQTLFPKVYSSRKQSFKGASCAKWPLPSSRKSYCTFWREQRRAGRTMGHWRFHHHGVYSLAALDQTTMHTGLFDICLLILYIRSANWILVCLFLSVLIYYFCF